MSWTPEADVLPRVHKNIYDSIKLSIIVYLVKVVISFGLCAALHMYLSTHAHIGHMNSVLFE